MPAPARQSARSAIDEYFWRQQCWDGVTSATTLELADVVLERAKVAFVPGEAFGLARYARFSFALGDDDLREGINRLASFVNKPEKSGKQ